MAEEENANVVGADEDEDEDTGPDGPKLKLELNAFRAQWMSELNPNAGETGSSKGSSRASDLRMAQEAARERKARELFLKAVEEEQSGAVYEAIKFYRRAIKLVPDIEFKINYNRIDKEKGENSSAGMADIEDLIAYFQQQLTLEDAWPKICQPETAMSEMHISALPPEVLMYIFRWVVSSDLDMRALEQLSLVCRGFYICARDSDLWRSACLRVWGRTALSPFQSWREMFLERPRVRFDGVYISKVSYVRQGEESLDGFYRAWHHVAYYRYLRFFPDGKVGMLTTPEDPLTVIPRLRSKNTRGESVMLGFYRLSQETDNETKVFVVVSKKKEEMRIQLVEENRLKLNRPNFANRGAEVQRNRFCRRNPAPEAEQNFHVGLKISSGGRHNKLIWIHHSCHITYRPTGETVVTVFNLDNMYAPFLFARVKSYTAFSECPL